jgi:hypothetical protein
LTIKWGDIKVISQLVKQQQTESRNNMKNQRGPGRPMAKIKVPGRKFTFADLKEANDHVTPLTLRKFLKRDAARKGKSEICLVKDETREPNSKKGLGRKTFVYILRSKLNALKNASKSKVSVPLGDKAPAATPTASNYEATKAALGITAPTEAPADVAPVSTEAAPVAA